MSARPVAPRGSREISAWDVVTDVAVVGGGCAGLSAALEAVRTGADTMLLERAGGVGGASAMSGGEIYLGGGTPIQEACGFTDTPEEMAKFLMAALGPNADADRVELYSAGSVEHFQWLVEQGVPFKARLYDEPAWVPSTDDGLMWMGENSWPFCEMAVPAPRGHRPQSEGRGGWLLMDRLAARLAETAVDHRSDTSVDRLVVDDDGRVVGLVAHQFGRELLVRARRGVVLCAGGFVFNDEMLAEHAPNLLGHHKVGTEGDDGRGIRMAQAVGARVRRMAAAQAALTVPIQLLVRSVLVNRVGQRFINEDTYGGLVGQEALFGRHTPVYLILDEEGFEGVPEGERLGLQPSCVAESLEELGREIGLPEGSLETTIGFYNEHARRGEDPLFHRRADFLRPLRPPFGAIDVASSRRGAGSELGMAPSSGFGVFTTGGLATSLDGEVLDLDGDAIPGLYAAGRTAAGMHGSGYISGTSLGDGTFFGRRAGRAVAASAA